MKKILQLVILLIPALLFAELNKTKVETTLAKVFDHKNNNIKLLFNDSFLKAVPPEKLTATIDGLVSNFGSYKSVLLKTGNNIQIYFDKAYFNGSISFDDKGLIAGFFIGQPKILSDNVNDIIEELKKLKGTVSLCIRKDGKVVFAYNKDIPLGVGSSFKLYVLRTLLDQIKDGKHSRNEVVHLKKENFSLPSGFLQNWNDGDPVTVQTLANMMIAYSDNTATDHLIDLAGKENIEKISIRNAPFFKTIELFKLKLAYDTLNMKEYCTKDLNGKREFLNQMKSIPNESLDAKDFSTPILIDKLEWFFTTDELCQIIETMKGESTLAINAGIADKKEWFYAGYKGGSEPGVLNYTHLLQTKKDSPVYSISATINDTQNNVDKDSEFTLLITRLIGLIQSGKI